VTIAAHGFDGQMEESLQIREEFHIIPQFGDRRVALGSHAQVGNGETAVGVNAILGVQGGGQMPVMME
jgi:hypothetical protein